MSRPRGPKRYDRIEDREEIKAICLEARDKLSAVVRRVDFGAPHYHATVNVGIALRRLAEMLGHPEPVGHTIGCNPPGHRRDD